VRCDHARPARYGLGRQRVRLHLRKSNRARRGRLGLARAQTTPRRRLQQRRRQRQAAGQAARASAKRLWVRSSTSARGPSSSTAPLL